MIKKHLLNIVEMIFWTDKDPYKCKIFKSYISIFGLGSFSSCISLCVSIEQLSSCLWNFYEAF